MNANHSREALDTLRSGKSPELEVWVMETFGRAFRRGQETIAEQSASAVTEYDALSE